MKKFYSILSVALAFSMLALTTSCKDDDDDVNKTALLTAKQWTLTKQEVEFQGEKMDADEIDECDTNSYLKFAADNKFTGVYNCSTDADDADTVTGTWEWKDGEKTLQWTENWGADGIDTETYEFVSIAATQLVLKQEVEGSTVTIGGTTYKAYDIYTFTGK
jgi:hypothetical protein